MPVLPDAATTASAPFGAGLAAPETSTLDGMSTSRAISAAPSYGGTGCSWVRHTAFVAQKKGPAKAIAFDRALARRQMSEWRGAAGGAPVPSD